MFNAINSLKTNTDLYLNEIPSDWKTSTLKQVGLGCVIGGIRDKTLNSTLLFGAALGTANLIHCIMTPLLKKINNGDIRETINLFARTFIVISIPKRSLIIGLKAGMLLAAFNIFSVAISSKVKIISRQDCNAAATCIYRSVLLTGNPMSGLIVGGVVITARVVVKFAYPFFQSKIEKYKIFEKMGLQQYIQELPSGWGLGCANRIISDFSLFTQLSGNISKLSLGFMVILPLYATLNYLFFSEVKKSSQSETEKQMVDFSISMMTTLILEP